MNLPIEFTENCIICNGKKFDRQLIERIISLASDPAIKHAVDDGFCGMGGVTAGFSQLPGWIVISCINHWSVAIETHQKNHPDCLHLLEDFRVADITILQYMHQQIRKNNPNIKFHLWLSLECTNFSNAKGGMSRDADSRTLADYADRYVIALNPDVIWIENVKEFKLWGPMIPKVVIGFGKKKQTLQFNPDTDNAFEFFKESISNNQAPYCPLLINKKAKTIGKWMIPEKARQGQDFNRWKKHICSFGYDKNVGERLLNCADYGIPQHRIRLIMQFNRTGLPAYYPKPTHDKKGRNGLPCWNPVKPCLDLTDEGESVLSFKTEKGVLVPRISSPKTIDRLINGTDKHVLNSINSEVVFITKFLSNNPQTNSNSGASVNDVSACLNTQGRLYFTKAHLLDHYFGNGYMNPVSVPAGTTGTKDGIALHSLQFLTQRNTGLPSSKNTSLENTSRTITGSGGNLELVSTQFAQINTEAGKARRANIVKSVVKDVFCGFGLRNPFLLKTFLCKSQVQQPVSTSAFLGTYHSAGDGSALNSPSPAIMTKDKYPVYTATFLDQQFTSGQQHKSIESPSAALLANPKQKIVNVDRFILDTQFNNGANNLGNPSGTITANRKHYYIVNFQWFNASLASVNRPSNTIIARQDKSPNYLITLETGELAIEVFEHDPPHYVRLKKYMAENGIIGINMRMLKEVEMLRIMTIPEKTRLSKSSTHNKKMIGNAVPSDLIIHLGRAYDEQHNLAAKKAA